MPIEIKDASGRVLHMGGRDTLNQVVISYRDLRGADLSAQAFPPRTGEYLQPLFGVCFDYSDLRGADFAGQDLTKCSFVDANLRDAIFDGAKLNWLSPDLVSEILWRAATTDDQREYAVRGLAIRECWDKLINANHPLIPWGLSILAPWVKPEDNAPHFLKVRAKALALSAGRDWHDAPNLSRYPNLTYSPVQHGSGVRTDMKGVPVDEIHASAVASGLIDKLTVACQEHGVDIHELCDAIRYSSA
jgi:Pentapeptide repeats (8 copies)